MAASEKQQSIGRFELTAEIGRGSMGIVHRAHDPVMGRDVAIKTVLLPHGLPAEKKEEFHERFLREARAAGRLSHPGIVTVYDFNDGIATGRPFIAMEYVDGPTLHDLIDAEGSLNPRWALSVGEMLADALQTAHHAGIVHRDLKPANILVRQADGVAKISDFGVARINRSELTAAGTAYGSPAYMAPERLRGAPADARSDLFALAVILYEILCGHRPFGGDDFASTCAAILHEQPPSIREREPNLAPACDRFFARALAKDPDERFQTGADFREALRALQYEQDCFQRGETTGLIQVAVEHRPGRDEPSAATAQMDLQGAVAGSALPFEVVAATTHAASLPTTYRVPTQAEITSARRSLTVAASVILLLLIVVAYGWGVRGPSSGSTTFGPQPPGAAALPAGAPDGGRGLRQKTQETRPADKLPSTTGAARSAHLDLLVRNRVKSGTLTLFVDGEEVYSRDLAKESPKPTEPTQVASRDRDEISAKIDIAPGPHVLRARFVPAGDSTKVDESVKFEIEAGDKRGLAIGVGRGVLGRRLTLSLEERASRVR